MGLGSASLAQPAWGSFLSPGEEPLENRPYADAHGRSPGAESSVFGLVRSPGRHNVRRKHQLSHPGVKSWSFYLRNAFHWCQIPGWMARLLRYLARALVSSLHWAVSGCASVSSAEPGNRLSSSIWSSSGDRPSGLSFAAAVPEHRPKIQCRIQKFRAKFGQESGWLAASQDQL